MKSRFVKLPNAVLEDSRLGKSELAVFACLHALSGNVYMGEKQVKASRKLIASYCNISVKTVTKAVKKLRELGYIKKIRQYFVDAHKLGTYIYILNVVKGTKYFFVSRDVFKMGLSVTQLYVYMFCCKCADSKTRRFWNSYNDISDKLGISRSGAINTVAQLVEMKLITQIKIIKKNGSYSDNHYIINPIENAKAKIRKKKSLRAVVKAQVLYIIIQALNHIAYIINLFYQNVKQKFLFIGGSPKITPLILVPTFNIYRKRKPLRLYLKYRCNLEIYEF